MSRQIKPEGVRNVVSLIPDSWLADDIHFETPDAYRDAYSAHLLRRLEGSRAFVEEAIRARS
jgi:hypothetical protein